MADSRTDFPVEVDEPPRKILFLGDEKIGKTTFIRRFCEHMRAHYRCHTYNGYYLVFTQFLVYYPRYEKRIPIRLLDLPAGTTEESRRDQYPAEANLVVLCYAVDDMASFQNVTRKWLPEFRQHFHSATRFALLGLKNDMYLQMWAANQSPVTSERGRQIHEQYGFSGDYFLSSVEANPEQAIKFMDALIDDTFVHSPPPRVVIN